MNDHAKGVLITTLGVLFVVPDALFVRLITADAVTTAFWRSLTSGTLILLVILLLQGPKGFGAVRRCGWLAAVYIALMATTSLGFVLAVRHTSVAKAFRLIVGSQQYDETPMTVICCTRFEI